MPGTSTEQVVDKGIRQKSTKVNSFTDGSAFCPGAPKRVPSDSEKHRRVYTSSNVCHSHEWRVDTASGKTLKKRNACLHAVRQAVEKKFPCLNGLRSEGVNGTLSSKTVLLYGVLQGSVLGPQFFIIYTGPIAGIAKKHGLQVHLYVDDVQLYISFNPKLAGDEQLAVECIQNCLNDIKQWMRANKLKLN